MKTLSVVLIIATMLVISQNCKADAKVEEQVVGPTNAGGTYVVAPSGAHVAYVGMKGTRLAVTADGAEGPVFDELYAPYGQSYYCPQQAGVWNATQGGLQGGDPPVIFSVDGAHYAYAGRQGQEYVVIYDGKEIARGPRKALALNYGPLTISPKGRYVYWDEIKTEGGRGSWRLMMNGKAGPWSGHQTMTPVFSPDESRYAYNFGKVENYQQQMLIVDGKDAGYIGFQPVFTADNKLLLTISPSSATSSKPALLVNGKPVITGIGVGKIIPGPVGSHYAAIVRTKVVGGIGVDTLFMDGKEVPGTDGVQNVWFSADGKHWAAACENAAARSMFMVIDGKKGNEYQSVSTDQFYWTPDGSRFFYTVSSGGRPFLIVNGDEVAITSLMGYNPIAMPEVGNRYAFGMRDGSNRNFTLVIDGKSVAAIRSLSCRQHYHIQPGRLPLRLFLRSGRAQRNHRFCYRRCPNQPGPGIFRQVDNSRLSISLVSFQPRWQTCRLYGAHRRPESNRHVCRWQVCVLVRASRLFPDVHTGQPAPVLGRG